jgi:hypothetical protein
LGLLNLFDFIPNSVSTYQPLSLSSRCFCHFHRASS